MEERSSEILIHLHELSALVKDSINGFEQIEEESGKTRLKKFIASSKEQSQKIWEDVNTEILRLGGEIKTSGTIKGAVNHLFMAIKTDLLKEDINKVISNIEICEEINLDRYDHVLKSDLPPKIRTLLEQHRQMLGSRLQELRSLKDKV